MPSFIKKNIFQLLLIIPAGFTLIGTIIINFYLNQYGIEDYYILSSKNLITGTCFFIINFLFFCFCFFNTPSESLLTIVNIILKFCLFIALITWLLPISVIPYHLAGLMFISSVFCMSIFINAHNHWWNENIKKISIGKILFICLGVLCLAFTIIAILWACFTYDNYCHVVSYFAYNSIIGFFVIAALKDSENRSKSRSKIPLDKKFFFNLLRLISVLTIIFLYLIYNYSKSFYPFFPSIYGGGNFINEINISLKDLTINKGKIIHSNQNYIFLELGSSVINKIDLSEVKSLEVIKSN